ncbi:MAG: hypothetical protein JWM17_500 [Actinobacteria bacterium]|nr:hypothetical protein [Actinomycetota bacterium]
MTAAHRRDRVAGRFPSLNDATTSKLSRGHLDEIAVNHGVVIGEIAAHSVTRPRSGSRNPRYWVPAAFEQLPGGMRELTLARGQQRPR